LKEDNMAAVFRSEPTRAIFQSALAFGLAFAAMMSTNFGILMAMQERGWAFLQRITDAYGQRLEYNLTVEAISYVFALTAGALLAGILLAFCFGETRRIKRYLLAVILGWAIPLAVIPIAGLLLKTMDVSLRETILNDSRIVLTGLGFGIVFSLLAQDRKKTPWLLFTGMLGYYSAMELAAWLISPLFSAYGTGPAIWIDLAYIASVHGITGMAVGAMLGVVSGRWRRNATLTSTRVT
jgi:hypothetical protein